MAFSPVKSTSSTRGTVKAANKAASSMFDIISNAFDEGTEGLTSFLNRLSLNAKVNLREAQREAHTRDLESQMVHAVTVAELQERKESFFKEKGIVAGEAKDPQVLLNTFLKDL